MSWWGSKTAKETMGDIREDAPESPHPKSYVEYSIPCPFAICKWDSGMLKDRGEAVNKLRDHLFYDGRIDYRPGLTHRDSYKSAYGHNYLNDTVVKQSVIYERKVVTTLG